MKKLNVMAVMVAAALACGQSAFADNRVAGEKLDSGLGNLPATYSAVEFMPAGWVLGESLDSGLGELRPSYTAAEFLDRGWVRGESLDSGLGELPTTYTAAEFMPLTVTARRAIER